MKLGGEGPLQFPFTCIEWTKSKKKKHVLVGPQTHMWDWLQHDKLFWYFSVLTTRRLDELDVIDELTMRYVETILVYL